MNDKARAPRNRTVTCDESERHSLRSRLLRLDRATNPDRLLNHTICQNLFDALPCLPESFVDLLVIDPPYNADKSYNGSLFKSRDKNEYLDWVDSWFGPLLKVLKPTASIYVCCDWKCSSAIQTVAERYLIVQNRITWEREKGRGALRNWKNCSEDIWFLTAAADYTFNVDAIKLKRRVIAPYTDASGRPKDWTRAKDGDFRLTHPSNLWTDVSVPFWSMPENTDHPTQKPEKLIAKLLLASSHPGDTVLDPFLGSGTTSVVAKKLGRRYVGIELDEDYCCLAEKRLAMADRDVSIQGYREGVFWERNTLARQNQADSKRSIDPAAQQDLLFDSEAPK